MVGETIANEADSAVGDEQPFTWSTPLRHEAGLLGQLRRANHELLMSFSVALHASRRGSRDAAQLAISRCMQQIHTVQRLEALRLYPPISRRMTADPDSAAMVTSLRRESNAHVRRFLRLAEGLFSSTPTGTPVESVASEAEAVLRRYLVEKESRLYRFYALTAPADAGVS